MGIQSGNRFDPVRRSELFITPVILLIAALVRLLFSPSRGIWYDDAFSILLSQQNLNQIISGTAADTMPPFYYFFLHYWMKLSSNIFFIRLLNIILSLVVVYIVFLFGKEISGKLAGWVAALLTALAPIQVYHAQEVRMYVLLELSLLIYAWMFWRIFVSGRTQKINWIVLILAGIGAFYSHNLAVFVLVVPDVLLSVQKKWSSLGKLLLAQLMMAILFIPWLIFVPGQIEKIQTAFWTPKPGLVEIIQGIGNLYGYLPQPMIITAFILIFSIQALGVMALEIWKKWSAGTIRYLLVWGILPPISLFIISYAMRPVFVPRAFITSGLFTYLMVGVLTQSNINGGGKQLFLKTGIIPILFLLVSLVSLPNLYLFKEFPRSPFKQAAEALSADCLSDCMVVHDNKLSYFPMAIYQPDLRQVYIKDEPGTHNDTLAVSSQVAIGRMASNSAIEAASGKQEVYLVLFNRALTEYRAMGLEIAPSIKMLSEEYQILDTKSFGDIKLFHYKK